MKNLSRAFQKGRPPRNDFFTWLYGVIFIAGLVMVGIALMPFLEGAWATYKDYEGQVVYPLAISNFFTKVESGPTIMTDISGVGQKAPIIVEDLRDYGNIENWFVTKVPTAAAQTQEEYLLEIEKLGIFKAEVKVGGTNIDYNLIHFNPEARIGGYGAPVIFGHSMLRQFYNPKENNKERYKSVFSTIMTLQAGDEIKIIVDGLTYTYVVTDKAEVQPDDDYILAQNKNKRQIKLVTCVPEGTFLRRGVITADLKL